MLRTWNKSFDGLSSAGLLACVVLLGGFWNGEAATGQVLDPQQKDWIAKYEKQENAPDPGKMLLNKDAEPDLSAGFTSLFNGNDLDGWEPKGGNCSFEVKEGQIVGTCVPGSNSTYLCTKKSDYSDFIFTCELKWEVDGNTGIQFRSKSRQGEKSKKKKRAISDDNSKANEPIPETVYGPQVEMEGLGKGDRHWSGGIYGQSCGGYFYPLWLQEHKAARAAEKPDQWNRVTISAKGNVIKTWINGVPVAHWVDDGTYSSGFFGLQIHKGKAGQVLFRNIKVKELN